MVGTPRSTGCRTCRQRKKKCGEEKPHCIACISKGWPCPGYTKSHRFVSENAVLKRTYAAKKYLFESAPTVLHEEALHSYLHTFVVARPPGSTAVDRLAGRLVNILEDPKSEAVLSPQLTGTFMCFVPCRLGVSAALDAAVLCLCYACVDFYSSARASRRTLVAYILALKHLQICVEEEDLQTTGETICTSTVLHLCELLLSPPAAHRLEALMSGTKALVRKADPELFRSEFGASLLEFLRAGLIALDHGKEEEPLTGSPPWHHLCAKPYHEAVEELLPASIRLRKQFTDLFQQFSSVVRRGRSRTCSAEHDSRELDDLYERASCWYSTTLYPLVRDASSTGHENEPFHSLRRHYPDTMLALLECSSCALLVDIAKRLDREGHAICTVPERTQAAMAAVARAAFRHVRKASYATAEMMQIGLRSLGFSLETIEASGQSA